jgi:hypothetical protein
MKQIRKIKLALSLLIVPVLAFAQDQEATDQPDSAAVHSLRQMLSTDAYAGILKSMVNPATLQNPTAVCAQCHTGEDVERYAATIGPMLQMINPVNWVNPMAYWNMAVPMMDPETYTQWYNAYINKYGGLLPDGDAAGTESESPSTSE